MTAVPGVRNPRRFLIDLFNSALGAADAGRTLPPHLPSPPKGRTVVVGAGKAAAAMAAAVEAHWDGPLSGLVICPYDYGVPTSRIRVAEARHPVPDAAGVRAAAEMLGLVEGLTERDLVLALISGGGSALMALPAPGLTIEDKQQVTRGLLMCGAPISEINCVRKHLSAIKGGQLAAAAWPAPVHTLIVSDVPGDDPATVASGPTVADQTTAQQALEILRRYKLEIPFAVLHYLRQSGAETPKPGDPRLSRSTVSIIARAADGLAAAAATAREFGVTPILLGDAIQGEAREVARAMAGMALSAARVGQPAPPPCVLISGGEVTVTMTHQGRGGPNTEFALALALALEGRLGISAIACDTDGLDGASEAAGALVLPDTLVRVATKEIDAWAHLTHNDTATLFAAIDDLVVTGPTRTNINDFRAIYVPSVVP
jgi:hydroxypyruvate reductase